MSKILYLNRLNALGRLGGYTDESVGLVEEPGSRNAQEVAI